MTERRTSRVLAVFRHPTPYRDPLLDRLAALPGVDLTVMYLGRAFRDLPWEEPRLAHRSVFPRPYLPFRLGELDVAVHPAALAVLWRIRPDACILSGWIDPTVLAVEEACRLAGIPYALAGESFDDGVTRGWLARLRRRVVRRVVGGARSWLPAGSRAAAYFARMGADPARCHRHPTAPDANWWAREADAARSRSPGPRERHGLPGDGVVAYVGRLVEDKGPDVVVEAFLRLRRRRPVHLAVIGDGPLRAQLEARAGRDAVTFFGFRQPAEVASILAGCDVLALCSRRETWGAAACEALAVGLPIVLSAAVGAAPDLVQAGDVGAVVPVDDPAAAADAIEGLLDAPSRRTTMAERARARSVEWGHDLALRSLVQALRDCGVAVEVPAEALTANPALETRAARVTRTRS